MRSTERGGIRIGAQRVLRGTDVPTMKILACLGGLGVCVLTGCATGTVAVDFRSTEGYVDRGKIEVYFTDIEGESAKEFRRELHDALETHGRFIPQPYGKLPPELPDSLITIPAIVISGYHETREESNTYTESTGNRDRQMEQTTDIDEFHYLIKDGATLEELERGTVDYVSVSKQEKHETSFLGSIFGGIIKSVGEGLLGIKSHRREQTIKDLVASLVAHTGVRRVQLFKDGDLPELEEGIALVAGENFPDAIARFQAAVEKHERHKDAYKAYFDLGIAYEYDYQFEKALASLHYAQQLHPSAMFEQEIAFCDFFSRRCDWQSRFMQSREPDQ
jgi:tetratricopeptide (TPR) repeat protein